MAMRTHELHPALVHAPLTLLPLAAGVDVAAVLTRSKRLDWLGRTLWVLASGSAAASALAGLAASQEVEIESRTIDDMMYLHGAGNISILAGGAALTLWRLKHRATLRSALIGVGAVVLSGGTAYLGGEMVYRHGVGIGDTSTPRLFSKQAPVALARDAVRGLGWIARRTVSVFSGEPIAPEALEAEPAKRVAREIGMGGGEARRS